MTKSMVMGMVKEIVMGMVMGMGTVMVNPDIKLMVSWGCASPSSCCSTTCNDSMFDKQPGRVAVYVTATVFPLNLS